MRAIFFFVTLGLASVQVNAVIAGRAVTIVYRAPVWNLDSAVIESGTVIMREKGSGKLVQIQLEETAPDSGEFKGSFNIALGDSADKIPFEIYVPPRKLPKQDELSVYTAIGSGEIKRKPYVLTHAQRGLARIEIFETREQAAEVLQAYQESAKSTGLKPVPSEPDLAAAQIAEHQVDLLSLAADAVKRKSEREHLEQVERDKNEARAKRNESLDNETRVAKQKQAVESARAGDQFYAVGDFAQAEAHYVQAVDLDPDNTSYYFKYGVTQYRNQKFNDALVILNFAHVEAALDLERRYYIALCHYRLGEMDAALESFKPIAAGHDPVMAPSSAFYIGEIHFTAGAYPEAKKSFEAVIDTSKDPRMDVQAEMYLDRIASAMSNQAARAHKFNLNAVVGLMFDSNVLLAPDNAKDQGLPTNLSDVRLLTVGQLDYRPLFTDHHELTASLNENLTNSSKTTAAQADPFLTNLSLPYSYKGTAGKKGYRLTARPAIEWLYMDPTGTGTKSLILQSFIFTLDNTFVMTRDWFSTYSVEYRRDNSNLESSVGPNDQSANRFALRSVQAVFLDKARREALLGNIGVVQNGAVGSNERYTRFELGATFVRPIKWRMSWNLGLSAYSLDYAQADPRRHDFNTSLTTGISKPIRDWITWSLTGTFTRNNSDLLNYGYSKYVILTTATFNALF